MYPAVGGRKLCHKDHDPWLVMANTFNVTNNIQGSVGDEPELLHVRKLVPYHVDFGE